MDNISIIHKKCGEEMEIYGVTKDYCMGGHSVSFYCEKYKVKVEINEVGIEKVRKG